MEFAREKLNKRSDLSGRPHCKGVAIGVAELLLLPASSLTRNSRNTQQHKTFVQPARTLGRCEAPPCVFARVVSRSARRNNTVVTVVRQTAGDSRG